MGILIVDDEPHALENLAMQVEEALPNEERFAFTKPSEALACAESNDIEIAFLDVKMGGLGGIELARALREINPRTNIIFVTAYEDYALEAFSLHASNYLLKPARASEVAEALENLRYPKRPGAASAALHVQTFGNFEVFHEGKPLHFARTKSKELLAYLVHKRGTGCSGKELAAILFEDRPYSLSVQRQVQTAIHTMVVTLTDAGYENVIARTYNNIAVNAREIDCDYYRLLEGDESALVQFAGEYMGNYSWAEPTAGYLLSKMGKQ